MRNIDGNKSRNKNSIKPQYFIFIYIITAIMVLALTVSKYVSSKSTEKVAKIAVMANSSSVNIDLSDGVYPGFERVHTIAVSNVEENKVCEVKQKFVIDIEKDEFENIPLKYEIYTDQACTAACKIEPDEEGYYVSDDFIFNAGVEEEKKIYLKIKWPEEQNDEKYAFEIGYCTINVTATQID